MGPVMGCVPAVAAGLNGLGCRYAFYYRRQDAEPLMLANHDRFTAAGLVQVPILMAWAHLEAAGRANRDEICELDLEPPAPGLSRLLRTRRLPYHDVLLLMAALSDELCTHLVISRIGVARLNTLLGSALGLEDLRLDEARGGGPEAVISPRDCIQLFRARDALAPEERTWVEPMLQACPQSALWGWDATGQGVAHKRAEQAGLLHEWAYTARADMFVLTEGGAPRAVRGALEQIGELLPGE